MLARKLRYYEAHQKVIYRSNMSKLYADASYNHHFTAYHMQREKITASGLASRRLSPTTPRPFATETQTTSIEGK